MTIRTKASVQANFVTGAKPTQAQFADWIDSTVFIPGTTATGIIEVESTTSATARPINAVLRRFIEATVTSQAQRIIAASIAFEFLNAGTSASALSAIGISNTLQGAAIGSAADSITTFSSGNTISGLAEVITGHIESPSNKQYTLDRYAAFPYNVEWIAVKTSAGRVTTALKVEGSAIGGITAQKASATETIGSAGAGRAVAVGNTLLLECSGNSSGADLVFTVKVVRTP